MKVNEIVPQLVYLSDRRIVIFGSGEVRAFLGLPVELTQVIEIELRRVRRPRSVSLQPCRSMARLQGKQIVPSRKRDYEHPLNCRMDRNQCPLPLGRICANERYCLRSLPE